jgi:hypothetical protein
MSAVLDYDRTRVESQVWAEKFNSNDSALVKQAIDNVNDITRVQVREEGILRRNMPWIPITNDDLDRSLNPTDLIKIVDLEPRQPGASMLPLATQPDMLYMQTRRYAIKFARYATRRFTVDVDELRTNYVDSRTIFSDNSIKDMMALEDTNYFRAANTAMVGPDVVCPASGTVQWRRVHGNLTRDTIIEGFKIIPSTSGNLDTKSMVLNVLTAADLGKMTFNEYGGPGAEKLLLNGWTSDELRDRRMLVTIKKNLVPTNSIYYFADEKFIGKNFMLEDITMSVERKDFMIYFFSYALAGGGFGNTAGIGRMDLV